MTLEQFKTLLTKENITFILAVVGFCGTVYSGIAAFILSRARLRAKIIDYAQYGENTRYLIELRNLSTNPISVSLISIKEGRVLYPCERLRARIREFAGLLYRTPMFPLNLAPRTSYLYFLEFHASPKIALTSGTMLYFSFDTNRGTITKKLCLSDTDRYLHT